jgi:hypothetical protein
LSDQVVLRRWMIGGFARAAHVLSGVLFDPAGEISVSPEFVSRFWVLRREPCSVQIALMPVKCNGIVR